MSDLYVVATVNEFISSTFLSLVTLTFDLWIQNFERS